MNGHEESQGNGSVMRFVPSYLIAAVNLGGDSDSIGAVYGQLAGAYYGFDAIPDRWVKAVKTWEKVDALIIRFLDVALS